MCYIFLTRFFSGLFESIKTSYWAPTGVPAVVYLVEEMSKRHNVVWILACQNSDESSVVKHKRMNVTINNINFHILPYITYSRIGRIDRIFNHITTLLYCVKMSSSIERRMFYTDVANIVVAAILKTVFRVPVVVRVLGVKEFHKDIVAKVWARVKNPVEYIAYKAHYDLVVCSQDGSGVEYYLKKLFSANVGQTIVLNGVRKVERKACCSSVKGKVSLLFVGKLIEVKGVLEMIEAVAVLKGINSNFKLKIVGRGHLENKIRDMILNRKLSDHVTLEGSIDHRKMHWFYDEADIYVSINKLGNLSNTVLEAMSAGKCVVLLGKDEVTYSDEFTEKVIPSDSVIRIDRENIVGDLTDKLADLCENQEKIGMYSDRMRKFADEFLWSWDERIDYEIDLLQKVAKGEPISIKNHRGEIVEHGGR